MCGPPELLAEDLDQGRYQDGAHDECIEQNTDEDDDAELRQDYQRQHAQCGEDCREQDASGGNHAARCGQRAKDAAAGIGPGILAAADSTSTSWESGPPTSTEPSLRVPACSPKCSRSWVTLSAFSVEVPAVTWTGTMAELPSLLGMSGPSKVAYFLVRHPGHCKSPALRWGPKICLGFHAFL